MNKKLLFGFVLMALFCMSTAFATTNDYVAGFNLTSVTGNNASYTPLIKGTNHAFVNNTYYKLVLSTSTTNTTQINSNLGLTVLTNSESISLWIYNNKTAISSFDDAILFYHADTTKYITCSLLTNQITCDEAGNGDAFGFGSGLIKSNSWNNIVYVRNATSNTTYIYINGQIAGSHVISVLGSGTFSNMFSIGSRGKTFDIDHISYKNSSQYYSGVYVYNKALSSTDVAEIYNQRFNQTYHLYSPYRENINQFVAIDSWNGTELNQFSIIDTHTNQQFTTKNGLLYLNSSLNDYSGTGNTLTNSGATYTALGVKGNAYSFDGVDDYISFNSLNMDLLRGSTFSFYTQRTDSSTTTRNILSSSSTTSYSTIRYTLSGGRLYLISNTNSDWCYATDSRFLTQEKLHITISIENYICSIYVNGQAVTMSDNTVSNNITINRMSQSSSAFNGTLDEVTIWNRSLSSAEVLALYQNQTINQSGLVAYYPFDEISTNNTYPFSNLSDKSGNGNTLTNNGATWNGSSVTGIGVYEFNGSNYLTINSNLINITLKETNTYTICTEFSSVNTSVTQAIFSHRNASNSTIAYGLQGGQIRTTLTNSTGSQIGSSSSSLTSNVPYHICVVYKNPDEELWLNAFNQTGATVSGLSSAGLGTFIGTRSSPSNYLNGTIHKHIIFNRSLNSTEITALYNNQTILNGLVAYYDFDNEPTLYNFTASADSYMNQSIENFNISSQFYQASLHQSEVMFQPREILTNNTLSGNVTVSGMGYTATGPSSTVWNLSAGAYNVTTSVTGYFNKTFAVTVTALVSETQNLDNLYTSILKVNATNAWNNSAISSFTVNLTHSTYGTLTGTTTNGSYYFYALNGTYDIILDATEYQSINSSSITLNRTLNTQNYTFSLYPAQSIIFTFRDELTNAIVSNVTIQLIGSLATYSNTTTNGTSFFELISPDSYSYRYNASGYSTRFGYIEVTSRTAYQQTLFLLPSASGTNITVTVVDSSGRNIEGALVQILKYNVSTNTYEIKAQDITDYEGVVVFDAQLNTEYYKFIVQYPIGTVALETSPAYLRSTDLTLVVPTGGASGEDWFSYLNINSDLTFNSVTNNFRYTYTDNQGAVTQGCLYIYELDNSSVSTLINSSCSASASATILIAVDNATNARYRADAKVTINDNEYLDRQIFKSFVIPVNWGATGLLILALMTLAGVFLFLIDPMLVVFIVPIGITLTNALGITYFDIWVPAGVWCISILISYIISRWS